MSFSQFLWILGTVAVLAVVTLVAVAVYDIVQRKHAILRNFPVVGHLRYILETIGPELRQYIVTDNDEERPFSRDQRRWVYSSAKMQNNYFGFGTDNDLELEPNYLIVKHRIFPLNSPHPGQKGYDPKHSIPCAKVLGGYRERPHAFRPDSVIYVSAMSFGSLGGARCRIVEQRMPDFRLSTQHRRGRRFAAPFTRGRPDPATRDRLLRLP